MKFKKRFDENGSEVPTFKQLGITPEIENKEMSKGDEHFNRWYDSKVKAWQANKRLKNQQLSARRAERDSINRHNHWYNSLPIEKKNELILRAMANKDEIFEVFLKQLSFSSPLYQYYFNLLDRVKPENISIKSVEYSKLKRFPSYRIADDKLEGSPINYITMFINCFPPKNKSKKRIVLD